MQSGATPLASSGPSYSCCASDIVREGLKPSLADASCCIVDVVNGGAGRRACSRRVTAATCTRGSYIQQDSVYMPVLETCPILCM